NSERVSIGKCIRAPRDGALAVVDRRGDMAVIEMLKSSEHDPTRAEIEAEREVVRILEGGCKVPVGALARARGNRIQIAASIFTMDGKVKLLAERSGHVLDAVVLAREMGEELLEQGEKRIEETRRTVYV